MIDINMKRSQLQNRLNEIIFGTETKAGKNFDIFLLVVILLSTFVVLLDSVSTFSAPTHHALKKLEWFFTILFTVEYIARLYCSPHPMRYARSFYGLVDLISIVPSYIAIFFAGSQYFLVVRLLRLLRLFRILKLFRYSGEANLLVRALWSSRRKILIFLFVILVFAAIFGALMYLIEGTENGFTSIPQSIYWAIVTITTVGYGDVSPVTPLGKMLSSLVMILGYSIIAVPTGIITAELANEMRLERSLKRCKNCGRAGHETDAMHCKFCGASI